MFDAIARRLFGTANDRYVRGLNSVVDQINEIEQSIAPLSDLELKECTNQLKNRLLNGETLDQILPDAFATAREAAKRALRERPYDVQIVGAIILHRGMIAEMKTGEGKTLTSTMAVYLNAIEGKGVHIVTVNDYLARRDAEWMGKVYDMLGLTVGCVIPNLSEAERAAAYRCDITYGTNSEFGFDYLRDNMKFELEEMVQRPFNFAIVDEVDSILIDEARTPLIISGASEDSSELYGVIDKLIQKLVPEDYEKDEKIKAVTLTDLGNEHIEEILIEAGLLTDGSLYEYTNITLVHHVNQALKANKLFEIDKDYIVHEGQVVIVDEFTGRMMEGRRFSEGLHQALEAKEGVEVENENQTLASITYQNYFRMYPTLAGMTGTAMTEAGEFQEIYKLEASEIPTNEPCIRIDGDDEVYRTEAEKHFGIQEMIKECQKRNQPVLVGTVSIEKSEEISRLLKKGGIEHKVLNARFHEQEALIIAQAGAPAAVTIATNMAGRGTDIQLGGNIDMLIKQQQDGESDQKKYAAMEASLRKKVAADKETVKAAGGLYIIGTERHESRRIDNQLRGRSGRQGDPGGSKFYLSLEDDLMRIFGSERMDGMLQKLGLEEGEAIVHPWINKALEKAQQKVEARNFDIRKNLLKYDDVMNDQRKVIYEQRKELMNSDDVSTTISDMRYNVVENLVTTCIPAKAYQEQWDTAALHEEGRRLFGLDFPIVEWAKEEGVADEQILERVVDAVNRKMAEKAANWGLDVMREVEKNLLLQVLDQVWKDHLLALDHLRQGIGLRAYAQKDPLNEYKGEAFDMFNGMLTELDERITSILAHMELELTDPSEIRLSTKSETIEISQDPMYANNFESEEYDGIGINELPTSPITLRESAEIIDPEDPVTWGKVGRNSACPCNSGKKYKHCHGAT
jgi:preprotein translocase subunit SecA